MNDTNRRGKFIAIVTGFFSVLIGLIYLVITALLDFRGMDLLPPPSEALGAVVVPFFFQISKALLLDVVPFL